MSPLLKKLHEIGIPDPPEEVTDSTVTRWGRNKRYWAVRFKGGYALGDWVSNFKSYAFEDGFDYNKCRQQIEEARRRLDSERNAGHREAAAMAQRLWQSASDCLTHPYLTAKRVKSHGLKVDRQTLLIPLRDERGDIASLQKIWPADGKFVKGFLKGSRLQGCCLTLGSPEDTVVICEGYATGATIFEITQNPVVIVFSSTQLPLVSVAIRKKYPNINIIVAADNDKYKPGTGNPGVAKAKEAAKLADGTVLIPEFKDESTEPTDFNDLYLLEGEEKVRAAFTVETKEEKPCVPAPAPACEEAEITDEFMPGGFRLTSDSLFFIKKSEPLYLCAYIRVLSKTVNIDTNETGKLLEFRTIHGEIKKICIRNKDLFSGNTQTILKDLAGAGLHINLEAPTKKILVYINNYTPKRSLKTTRKSGWCANGFLTENGIITIEEREEDILLDTAYGSTYVAVSGSTDDWKENVAKYCRGNSRLVLAASTAFTAPLLHLLDRPNFGIQLVGKSSAGKTTALYVAASVYGPRTYVKSWRATDNGLETVAFNHNDMLLVLDEMGEMSPQKIGATVYMLANGVGKTRANTAGDAKQPKTWRIALLAAGEVDLNSHMASAGLATMAGQNIRLLPVPAVPEGCRGLVENNCGFSSPAALVKHLINATQRCYGAPLPEYIRLLMRNREKIIDDFNEALEARKTEILPSYADGQDNRVFDFFFTAGFAGELATAYGLTGWSPGEAAAGALRSFKDWVAGKGGFGNQEEKMLLDALRCFFQKYQHSRFLPINDYNDSDDSKIVQELMGYRKNSDTGVVFYAYPERLKQVTGREIAADFTEILKLADSLGMLERTDGRHFTKKVRVRNRILRMLVFNSRVLADEE